MPWDSLCVKTDWESTGTFLSKMSLFLSLGFDSELVLFSSESWLEVGDSCCGRLREITGSERLLSSSVESSFKARKKVLRFGGWMTSDWLLSISSPAPPQASPPFVEFSSSLSFLSVLDSFIPWISLCSFSPEASHSFHRLLLASESKTTPTPNKAWSLCVKGPGDVRHPGTLSLFLTSTRELVNVCFGSEVSSGASVICSLVSTKLFSEVSLFLTDCCVFLEGPAAADEVITLSK